jgi:hypothetical protein
MDNETKDCAKTCGGCFGICILALVSVVVTSVFAGFVFVTLWGWFAVPFGLPAIGIFQSLGIMTLFGMFLVPMGTQLALKAEKEQTQAVTLAVAFLARMFAYALVLLSGWVYYLLFVAYPAFGLK